MALCFFLSLARSCKRRNIKSRPGLFGGNNNDNNKNPLFFAATVCLNRVAGPAKTGAPNFSRLDRGSYDNSSRKAPSATQPRPVQLPCQLPPPANMALFGSTSAAASSTSTTQGDNKNDIEVSPVPGDSIQDLQFSPTADFLAVASWDKKVYIYEITASGANGKWMFDCQGYVLGLGWSKVRHVHVLYNAQHLLTAV